MDRNWRVVMMVAKSRAPNSRMVYKMHSCPHVDAAQEQGRRSVAHTNTRGTRLLTHLTTYFAFARVKSATNRHKI